MSITRLALPLLLLLFSFQATAKIVAVVSKLEGKAFYTSEGKTHYLKEGMHIPTQAEIFTDLGAQLSVNDYYDHVYHLAGGGHMIVHTNLIELKEGYLWVKSLNYDELKGPFRVTTANAVVENRIGEGIISFDIYTGKTQLLSIEGNFEFRNAMMEQMGTTLGEGQFSFIHIDHEQGMPRRPTPIGYASYKKVTGLFHGIEPFKKEEPKGQKSYLSTAPPKAESMDIPQREVASVKTNDLFEKAIAQKKGTTGGITVIKLREPASERQVHENVLNYYQQKVHQLAKPKSKKKWTPEYGKRSGVSVKVFGKKRSVRNPASVSSSKGMVTLKPGKKAYKKKSSRTPASIGGMLPKVNNNAFESQLLDQYKNQMRHDQEVNDLIDQLQSVDMDYKKEY